VPDSSEIYARFEQLLRRAPHRSSATNKYRPFERYLGELLGIEAAEVYTVYVSKSGNFDVRMTQSQRARQARLRVALLPDEPDSEGTWDWNYMMDLASRMARVRYPGTAVLLVHDKKINYEHPHWTPVWGIEPGGGPESPLGEAGHLSSLRIWLHDFELQDYPYTPPAVNLTEQAAQILEELSAHPAMSGMLYRLDPRLFARLIEDDVSARDVIAIAHRRAVVDKFRRLLKNPQFFAATAEPFGGRKEAVWQNLLEENPWILGVSLAGQLLTSWNDDKLEQVVAGFSIDSPGKRADAVMQTNGRIRALVLAEIKHHDTLLLGNEYRAGCWEPSTDLAGGTVQVQQTVHLAGRQINGRLSETDESGAETGEHTYMVRPRSFLILGNLQQLRGSDGVHQAKYQSFELYRRNLYEPEVITFDELLARAEWHVEVLDEEEYES
jgi:Domain of unknown function (DUF4263)